MPVEGWPGSPTDLKVGWGTCLVEGSPGSLGPTWKALKPLYLSIVCGWKSLSMVHVWTAFCFSTLLFYVSIFFTDIVVLGKHGQLQFPL